MRSHLEGTMAEIKEGGNVRENGVERRFSRELYAAI